jgi:general secretion pathway protein L
MIKISDALLWWREGLAAWLPDSFQQKTQQKPVIQCAITDDKLVLNLLDKAGQEHDTLTITLLQKGSEKSPISSWLKRYPHHETVLCVAADNCLIKQISMPEKARDNLDEMIKFEVERQTPFAYDAVYVGYRINKDKGSNQQTLSVTLVVVPLQYVATLVAQLSKDMLVISSLFINDTDSSTVTIPLAASAAAQPIATRLNYSLATLALILLLLVLYQPVLHYDDKFEAIQLPLAVAKKQAKTVGNLKQANTVLIERGQFVETKLKHYRSRLVILRELAAILPAHTWLEQSEIRDNVLTIRGESDSAADLVTLLTNSGYFSNVRFNSSTTRNNRSGKDRFTIGAKISPSRNSNAD